MISQPRQCDVCGEGTLSRHQYFEDAEHNGHAGKVRAQSSICNHCGIDIADALDSAWSRREWNRFRKAIDNVPLGKDILAMRKRAGLTQEQAADLFGGGAIAFSRYENDDVIPDTSMVNLLRLAIRYPDTVERLRQSQKPLMIDHWKTAPEFTVQQSVKIIARSNRSRRSSFQKTSPDTRNGFAGGCAWH